MSDELSCNICSSCNTQLTEFCVFKENALEFQERLFNFTSITGHTKFKKEPNWDESSFTESSLMNVSVKVEPEDPLVVYAAPFKVHRSNLPLSSSKVRQKQVQKNPDRTSNFLCDLCGHRTFLKQNLAAHVSTLRVSLKAQLDNFSFQQFLDGHSCTWKESERTISLRTMRLRFRYSNDAALPQKASAFKQTSAT